MAAAGTFKSAVGLLVQINVVIGLLGAACLGVSPPTQASSVMEPPSHCVAQHGHYERAALLSFVIFHTVTVSVLVAFGVQLRAGGGGLGSTGARTQAWLRLAALLAVALSAVAGGLAVAAWTTVLEIKVGVFACLPAGVRAAVYASCGLVGAAGAGFYYGLATAVMRWD